jgi:PRC-barrel domain
VVQNKPDAEQPIAWRAIVEDEPVRSSDGEDVGTVYDVLGSKEDDIFHGIVVHLGRLGHRVLVLADDVSLITASHLDVDLTSAQLRALPKHEDEHTFHLGVTGLFRMHVGWTSDQDR